MKDLTVDQVLGVHDRILSERLHDHRITSEAALHQMVFQANLVPECIPRAALVFYLVCAYPPFREGNEETAAALSLDILLSGGFHLTVDPDGLEHLAGGIRDFTTDEKDVECWLREHTGNP